MFQIKRRDAQVEFRIDCSNVTFSGTDVAVINPPGAAGGGGYYYDTGWDYIPLKWATTRWSYHRTN